MPRPNAKWKKKFGNGGDKFGDKKILLAYTDTVETACQKLAKDHLPSRKILDDLVEKYDASGVLRLLDIDDMQMHGPLIEKAYTQWACGNLAIFVQGLVDRDSSLVACIRKG